MDGFTDSAPTTPSSGFKVPLKASFSDRYGRTGARRTGAGRASLAPASWDRIRSPPRSPPPKRNSVASESDGCERGALSLLRALRQGGAPGPGPLMDLPSPLWGRGSRQP